MKESYGEDLASRPDRVDRCGKARPGYQALISYIPRADPVMAGGRQHLHRRHGEPMKGAAESKNPCMSGIFQRENREIPWVSTCHRGPCPRAAWNGRKKSPTDQPT
jgi:hypothetical protein